MNRASVGRLLMKVLIPAVVVACSAVGTAVLTGTASAGAVQPHKPPTHTMTETYKFGSRFTIAPSPSPSLTVYCGPKLNGLDRTQSCWGGILTFTYLQDGIPKGILEALLVQYISLNPRGDTWSEYDTIVKTEASGLGKTVPVYIDLLGACDKPCEATALFSGEVYAGLPGTVVYYDGISNKHVHTTPTHYIFNYSDDTYIPLSEASLTSPHSYRCDNGVAEKGTGCVFPSFTPTLELSRKRWGASAALVQWAQQHMSAHWGCEAAVNR